MSDGVRFRLSDEVIAEQAARLVVQGELAWGQGQRFVLGIAGVPGSGKSTLAQRLCDAANRERPGVAVYAPMDGFHFSNKTLRRQKWGDRKGAPFTYDALGYRALLTRYRQASESGPVPVYSREVHEPVESKYPVTENARLIVAEGQYLLLTDPPWVWLEDVMGETWWLETPPDAAKRWTIQRHVSVGRTPAEAQKKYEKNDGPNSRLVRENRRTPDHVVAW